MNRREFSKQLASVGMTHAFLQTAPKTAPPAKGFKFSVMLWTLEKLFPFDQCLDIVAQAGYTGVELVGEPDKWSPEDTRRIIKKMSSLGLVFDAMTGGSVVLADPAGTADILRQVTHRTAIAKNLGCSQLILTSGKRMETLSPEAQFDAVVNNLKQVAKFTSRNGMEVLIEPIDLNENKSAYLNSVSQAFQIVHAVGSPSVKVLYDFYHEQQAGGDLINKLEKNIDQVGLVHIADVPGRHDPGTGEIDYPNIYRALAKLKYDKYIAMEFYPVGDPVTALRTARRSAIQAERG
ncbi:MAG TPA: TIM barrel protein [Acidobacteriaceae bacterium]|nr:TIM barrel protein [Acidobacteriaceae bacterium]